MKRLTKQTHKRDASTRRLIGLILLLIIILISGYLTYLYMSIQSEKTIDYSETEQRTIAETPISHIDDIKRFHGHKYYHIVYGSDEETNEYIAFVDQSANEEAIYVQTTEIVNEQSMFNQWEVNCESCDFIRMIPAMIDDDILWEITYVDEANKYVLDYYSMYDGQLLEQMKLLQIFK